MLFLPLLQGIETEGHLIDEMVASLQQSEPLLIKLHNYKRSGEKFLCLLALTPIFGQDGDILYQVGLQLSCEAEKTMEVMGDKKSDVLVNERDEFIIAINEKRRISAPLLLNVNTLNSMPSTTSCSSLENIHNYSSYSPKYAGSSNNKGNNNGNSNGNSNGSSSTTISNNTPKNTDSTLSKNLLLVDIILSNIPRSLSGDDMFDVLKMIPYDIMGDGTVQPYCQYVINQPSPYGNVIYNTKFEGSEDDMGNEVDEADGANEGGKGTEGNEGTEEIKESGVNDDKNDEEKEKNKTRRSMITEEKLIIIGNEVLSNVAVSSNESYEYNIYDEPCFSGSADQKDENSGNNAGKNSRIGMHRSSSLGNSATKPTDITINNDKNDSTIDNNVTNNTENNNNSKPLTTKSTLTVETENECNQPGDNGEIAIGQTVKKYNLTPPKPLTPKSDVENNRRYPVKPQSPPPYSLTLNLQRSDNQYNGINAALTKIMWLQDPLNSLKQIIKSSNWRINFVKYVDNFASLLIKSQLDFLLQSIEVEAQTNGLKKMLLLQSFYSNKKKNRFFYCAFNENENDGKQSNQRDVNETDWLAVLKEMSVKKKQIEDIIIVDCFPRFLDHALSVELINIIHAGKSTIALVALLIF